jgi:pectinesterase
VDSVKFFVRLCVAGLLVQGLAWGGEPKGAAEEAGFDAIVAADGSGDYATVQAAVAAVPDDGAKEFRIMIRPGRYEGQIMVPKSKRHVSFIGGDAVRTVLTYAKNVKDEDAAVEPYYKGNGVVILADDFRAERLTFENTSGDHGQAMALRVDGDRAVFAGCRLLGWQDTLMANDGRHYFHDCYLEGRVDFIYGSATAVFDRCTIHSKNGGYITAASTPAERPFGLVFLDCKLTGDEIPWLAGPGDPVPKPRAKPNAELGRPWRPYASTIFVRCDIGDHIKPGGWNNWGHVENEKTARYAEYHNHGSGADPQGRVAWAMQLSDADAEKLTVAHLLGGTDGWNPAVAR